MGGIVREVLADGKGRRSIIRDAARTSCAIHIVTNQIHLQNAEFSTWRPMQRPAAKQVHVQMRYGLAGSFFAVDNEPIAIREAEFVG